MKENRRFTKENPRRDAVLRRLRSIFLENWGTKLLALFIAVALWAGLITQDPALTRTKSFRNVAVTVSGADTLRRNGYVVISDLDDLLDDVSISVEAGWNYPAGDASPQGNDPVPFPESRC